MTPARRVAWIGLLLFGEGITACRNRGAEIHIIPEGFAGPVVIVYGVPGGEEVNRDDEGTTVYRIPPDGKLFLKRPPPKPGWYRMTYVIAAGDGMHELPNEFPTIREPNRLQILGRTNGNAPRDVGKVVFVQYFVGIPSQQPAWGQRLEHRTDEVIAEAAARMTSTGRVSAP